MKYFTFHIDDSGAIENVDYKKIRGEYIAICKMYDDDDFNKLNDFLHSINEYIVNEKALKILKESKTIQFELRKAKVLRKEKLFGFLKKNKSYDYFQLTFPDKYATECYNWIDFSESEIFATENGGENFKIQSHQHKLDLISENKTDSKTSYSFETKKVVFGKNFDYEIDFFKIPLYSSGKYVSERFKVKMEKAKITDIRFSERKEQLNKIWQPMFPIIEFDIKNDR
ncbi:hypothetical protein H7U19_13480 [Hyunsoonleella sp. SJ7]|uniref:Uncharacterized protein n=1 Tax=Hyunsoonleella aquatilis TaxID=2762758 RepID=A0A923KMU0_9FLAO|nr:hypothetical protein [Hyunsoonleella aquatilis]MBC3759425.1 hypothetical protein [Hyunsoonleella aquatilis]